LHDRSPYVHLPEIVASITATTFAEFVTQLFERMSDVLFEHMSFVQLVFLDIFELKAVHLQSLIGEVQEQVLAIIQSTQTLEGVRTDLPPIAIMRMIGMTIFGYTLSRHFLPPTILNVLTEEEWKTHIIGILLHGFSSDKAVSP
jgi:hypothetical protein